MKWNEPELLSSESSRTFVELRLLVKEWMTYPQRKALMNREFSRFDGQVSTPLDHW